MVRKHFFHTKILIFKKQLKIDPLYPNKVSEDFYNYFLDLNYLRVLLLNLYFYPTICLTYLLSDFTKTKVTIRFKCSIWMPQASLMARLRIIGITFNNTTPLLSNSLILFPEVSLPVLLCLNPRSLGQQ